MGNTCGWWHQVSRARKLSRPHLTTLRVNDRVQRECSVLQNLIILQSGGSQSANWHWLCSRKYSPFKTTQKFQYVLLKIDNSSKLSLVNQMFLLVNYSYIWPSHKVVLVYAGEYAVASSETNLKSMTFSNKKKEKLRGLSPRANYTDRAAAAGRRS